MDPLYMELSQALGIINVTTPEHVASLISFPLNSFRRR